MPTYFLSDVHLRLDRPDRGQRLAEVVDRLGPDDTLVIVGDLCDFWMASRQTKGWKGGCAGLESLRRFRERGGKLSIVRGNHDAGLDRFYEQTIGVRFSDPVLDLQTEGFRVRSQHGHEIGARTPWKKLMEGRAFLAVFSSLPGFVAANLERMLNSSNQISREEIDRKHLAIYRNYAQSKEEEANLFVFGHIHLVRSWSDESPSVVVLGSWHKGASYLRLEDGRMSLITDHGSVLNGDRTDG